MDLQSEYCSHMGNILKLGRHYQQVVYLESCLFPSLLLLVGDLRRSGRLKKRVRFTFPTLFAKKTYYLPTYTTYTYYTIEFQKVAKDIDIALCRYVRLRTNNLEKLSRFQKLPAYSELNIYNPAVQSILRRVKNFYIGIIFFHFPMCYYQSILITDRLALSSKVAGLTYTVIIQSIYIYLQYVKAKCLI